MAKIHEIGIQDEMFRIFFQRMGNKAAAGCVRYRTFSREKKLMFAKKHIAIIKSYRDF